MGIVVRKRKIMKIILIARTKPSFSKDDNHNRIMNIIEIVIFWNISNGTSFTKTKYLLMPDLQFIIFFSHFL